MPQLNLYVNDEFLNRIRAAARMANMSISKWVRTKLLGVMVETWPDGYFDVFGSLAGEDLARPLQGNLADDAGAERAC